MGIDLDSHRGGSGISRRIGKSLLVSVSASAVSVLLASGASAQAVPAECTPTTAITGGTIVCIAPAPAEIGGISTNVDDLTIVIGDATTPTTVNEVGGDGVSMNGANGQTLNILNSGSSVTGSGTGVSIQNNYGPDDLTIVSEGSISGNGFGIYAANTGDGSLSITSADVTGITESGIKASNTNFSYDPAGANLTINSTGGSVSGARGIDALNYGSGALTITTADVTGAIAEGIQARHGHNSGVSGTDLTIDSSAGSVTGGTSGSFSAIYARNLSSGTTSITTGNVTARGKHGIEVAHGTTTTGLTLNSAAGTVSGVLNGIDVRQSGTGSTSISANLVTGGTIGINSDAASSDTTITLASTAVVTGMTGAGIVASSNGADADITVQGSSGDIVGGTDGLDIDTMGADILVQNLDSVTGNAGDGIDAVSNGGDITITGVGTITGTGGHGILADAGTGAISITNVGAVGGVSGTGFDYSGINARSVGGGITVDSSAGTVSGSINGIRAFDSGAAAVSVTSADVTATMFEGIIALGIGGSVTVDSSAGTVSGGTYGIRALDSGAGAVSVTSADVTGTSRFGIYASSRGVNRSGGDVEVDSTAGTVSSGLYGIDARAQGAGSISVSTANVTGGSIGIRTIATDGATTITLGSTAVVTGTNAQGIRASSTGADADITVQGSSGDIIGGTDGMDIDTMGADILVQNLDSVTGNAGDGIDAVSNGGDITITGVDTITGTGGNGILAVAGAGDISIQGSGLIGGITGTGSGVLLIGGVGFNNGSGILAFADGAINIGGIEAIGDVTSTNAIGIFARSNGGGVTVDSRAGSVSGRITGINAFDTGAGAVLVTSADVTGTFATGIYARSIGGGVTVDSSAGSVSGPRYGIFARDRGAGAVLVTSADVTSTSATGIYASSDGGGVTVDSTAGSVTGGFHGIYARDLGAGSISVSTANVTGGSAGILTNATDGATTITLGSAAVVTGTSAQGIVASSTGADADITVQGSSGDIIGGTDGLDLDTMGADILVQNLDSVTGNAGDGIDAVSNGGDITIENVGAVTGTGGDGIYADARGGTGGQVNIGTTTAIGNVSGSRFGISARTDGAGGISIDSSAGSISASDLGIRAINDGTGDLSITSAGIESTGVAGIFAVNNGANLTIDTSAGSVVGGANLAIFAINSGTGDLSVTTGDLTGIVGDGLQLVNTGVNLTIDTSAGMVLGEQDGIQASNLGTGALSITTSDVTGTNNLGINAFGASTGTDVTVDSSAGTLIGGTYGAYITNYGTGAISVTSANVTGGDVGIRTFAIDGTTTITLGSTAVVTGTYAQGIVASSTGADADITVQGSSGAIVSGGTDGLDIDTMGADILVQNLDSVTGNAGDGIDVASAGGDITITGVDTILGTGGSGILAVAGAGDISIQGSGLVGGITGTGTSVVNVGGDNFSNGNGILAFADGAINIGGIEAIGDVTSATAVGIAARSNGGGVTVDSSAGSVNSVLTGIVAFDSIGGVVSVTTADVTSTNGNGIYASSDGGGVTVDSSAGSVSGGNSGIYVSERGAGAVSVTSANVTGGSNGISTNATDGATTITTLGSTTGGTTGILADAGTGELLLNSGGDVTGGENGLLTFTQNGTNFTVAAGQTISGGRVGIGTMATDASATSNDTLNILGTVDGAILTFAGDDTVTLANGSAVNGAIMLGDGTDTVALDGGSFGSLRGGGGVDSINFNAIGAMVNNSGAATDVIAEFEVFNFNADGAQLAGTNTGLTAVNFNAGNAIFMGSLASANVNLASGAGLQVGSGAMITGNLVSNGSLGLNMGAVGTLAIDGNLTQGTTGDLTLDIFGVGNSDLITVTGDVALAGTLTLNQSVLSNETITLIDANGAITGEFTTVNGLQNGLLVSQSIVTDAATSNVNLVSGGTDASLINGLTPNQAAAANALVTQFENGTLTGDLRSLTLGLGSTPDAATLSALLDELTPEIANSSIDGARLTQDRFRKMLMSQYQLRGTGSSGEVAALSGLAAAAAAGAKSVPNGPQIWGAVNYNYHRNDNSVNNKGYRADGFELTAGISNISIGAWQVGFATGFSDFDTNELRGSADFAESELFRFGVHGSTEFGAGALGINGHIDIALDYGSGKNNITMVTAGGLSGLGSAQNGEADIETYGMSFRLNFDGSGDKQWPIRPFISVAYDHFAQDSIALTGAGVTDLAIDKVDLDRIAFGYGLRADHRWDQTELRLGLTGYHYEGDTQSSVTSRFLATGINGSAFTTTGFDIQDHVQLDAGISQQLGDGWSLSLDGYAGFGDLESYGGIFKIGRKF